MAPFQLHYSLSRAQRLITELPPWVPAIAGSLGFGIGVAVLASDVSRWFLLLLLIPFVLYRGLFALLFDIAVHSGQSVELSADEANLEVRAGRTCRSLPLSGIIQVFRSGNSWTVLHLDGSELKIPAETVSDEQINYLKSFARTAAAGRKAAQSEP